MLLCSELNAMLVYVSKGLPVKETRFYAILLVVPMHAGYMPVMVVGLLISSEQNSCANIYVCDHKYRMLS